MTPEEQRLLMVEEQLKGRGLMDERLLNAFRKIPRHRFVPSEYQQDAYTDHPLPIGEGQTISQPYMVALMIDSLRLQGHERVLEIGAGSGYQTALLAELALEVFAVERLPALLAQAQHRLAEVGASNVHLTRGNGSLGWREHAPYDAILVSAAAPRVPPSLIAQLAERGRMVLPIGPPNGQVLTEVEKRRGSLQQRQLAGCVFVPLIGEEGWPEPPEQS